MPKVALKSEKGIENWESPPRPFEAAEARFAGCRKTSFGYRRPMFIRSSALEESSAEFSVTEDGNFGTTRRQEEEEVGM